MITTISSQNLYTQIIDRLKAYILERNLQPGDRLPTEAGLAEQFGVSRSTVREALIAMENMGILQAKRKDGRRLRTPTFQPVTDHLRFVFDVEDITRDEKAQVRRFLETAIIPLVVENATESDFARMQASIDRAIALTERRQPIVDEDLEFHLALFAATGNRAMAGLGTIIQNVFRELKDEFPDFYEQQTSVIVGHSAILKALVARDVDTAQRLMWQHLNPKFYITREDFLRMKATSAEAQDQTDISAIHAADEGGGRSANEV